MEELVETLNKKVVDLEAGKNSQQNSNQGEGAGEGPMAWRRAASKEGKPTEKTVDGKVFKCCCIKSCLGQGLWTTGDGLHGTEEHDPNKSTRK